jgi:hypothetical protein
VNNALSIDKPTFFDIANFTALIRFSLLVSFALLFQSSDCNYRFSLSLDLNLQIPTYSLTVCSKIHCSSHKTLIFRSFCSGVRTAHSEHFT